MEGLKYSFSWLLSLRLVALDIVTLCVCGVIATSLQGYSIFSSHITIESALGIIVACLVCLSTIGGYETKRDMSTLRYASEHMLAMLVLLAVSTILTYVFSSYNESVKPGRSVILLTIIMATPLTLTYRYALSRDARRMAAQRFFYVIGTPGLASHVLAMCEKSGFPHPLRFINVTFEILKDKETLPYTLTGERVTTMLRELLAENPRQCAGVIIDLRGGEADPEFAKLLLEVNHHAVPVYTVASFIETFFYKIDLSHVSVSWALDGTFKTEHRHSYGRVKELIDIPLAMLALAFLMPLLLVIMLVIRLQDGGPALFTQVRIGRFGKPILLYKFRTMTISHDETASPYTAAGDTRITRFGQFLRLTHLDELPQLWNVAKGEMSIIGPRAEWIKLVERYDNQLPLYHLRQMVKPGITGWAQVNYGYGASYEDTLEKLQYDLYYVKHYSPHMDASIILKTIFTMLSGSGR